MLYAAFEESVLDCVRRISRGVGGLAPARKGKVAERRLCQRGGEWMDGADMVHRSRSGGFSDTISFFIA